MEDGQRASTTLPEYIIKHKAMTGVKLMILDTAGQEKYRALTRCFYRNTHCVIFVYDVCDRRSFLHIISWILEVNWYCEPVRRVLVGTKIDKLSSRQVSRKEGEEFAKLRGFHSFVETSAVSGESVDNLFYDIADILLYKHQKGLINSQNENALLEATSYIKLEDHHESYKRPISWKQSVNKECIQLPRKESKCKEIKRRCC